MLNISENSINGRIDLSELRSSGQLAERKGHKGLRRTFVGLGLVGLVMLFLPWTQNVPGIGEVTTLKPDQRPQALHSAIDGRIERWYVREGDYVSAGDTLLFISEVKEAYFDPSLLPRTQQQIDAKSFSAKAYREKVGMLQTRIETLMQGKELKMEQARNKIQQAELKIRSDSIDLQAAGTNERIAEAQYTRNEKLYEQGLISLTEFESRRLKLQEAQAKLISANNKLLTSRNELLNAKVELSAVENEYNDKIAKARAEQFETQSSQFDTEADVSKLESSYANYEVRAGLYFVKAPQSGYITKTLVTGLGETIKQGEEILTIMPATYDIAAAIYIEPRDLPLIGKDTPVRLIFDGWPAMVFSGWPGVSTGTFGGRVVAVDNFASENGKFRMLVAPDPAEDPWPEALRVGSGVKGQALLGDVPIWYEIWRQLNGFPPAYYADKDKSPSSTTEKASK